MVDGEKLAEDFWTPWRWRLPVVSPGIFIIRREQVLELCPIPLFGQMDQSIEGFPQLVRGEYTLTAVISRKTTTRAPSATMRLRRVSHFDLAFGIRRSHTVNMSMYRPNVGIHFEAFRRANPHLRAQRLRRELAISPGRSEGRGIRDRCAASRSARGNRPVPPRLSGRRNARPLPVPLRRRTEQKGFPWTGADVFPRRPRPARSGNPLWRMRKRTSFATPAGFFQASSTSPGCLR